MAFTLPLDLLYSEAVPVSLVSVRRSFSWTGSKMLPITLLVLALFSAGANSLPLRPTMPSAFPSPKWWRKRDDALSSSNLSTPTQTPTQTSVAQAVPTSTTSQKYVVAHHMVGNTFPYTIDDWAADIALAHSSGIDAFALNVGRDDWQPARVADA